MKNKWATVRLEYCSHGPGYIKIKDVEEVKYLPMVAVRPAGIKGDDRPADADTNVLCVLNQLNNGNFFIVDVQHWALDDLGIPYHSIFYAEIVGEDILLIENVPLNEDVILAVRAQGRTGAVVKIGKILGPRRGPVFEEAPEGKEIFYYG